MKSGPSDSGESTASSTTPNNGGFICHVCRKAFATKRALAGHKNAHRAIPAASKLSCCLHGRRCHVDHYDRDDQKPALVTRDLLREWTPIYAVRLGAQAPETGLAMKADDEEEDGMDLELKLWF